MPTRDRNEFLETDGSEDESLGYNSEEDELQKGRPLKKRRVEVDTVEDEDDDDDFDEDDLEEGQAKEVIDGGNVPNDHVGHEDDEPRSPGRSRELNDGEKQEAPAPEAETENRDTDQKDFDLPDVSKPLTRKNLITTIKAQKRSGVVYMSRVFPFMKPGTLRSLLEPYAPSGLNRIFLTPEDNDAYSRRVRNGGSTRKSFKDGWIEFVSKHEAKRACQLLNTQTIGGRKGSYYYDDVWNLTYLKNYKWQDLTREIAAENAERASRMRAELTKTRKEDRLFEGNVERAKMLDGMREKRDAKRKQGTGGDAAIGVVDMAGGGGDVKGGKSLRERPRQFKQNAVVSKKKVADQPENLKRVLSKIF